MTIDEKRLAEIREVFSQPEWRGDPWRMSRDLLAMLDATREDMRAIVAAAYPAQPDATPTVHEVREHIGALHDAAVSAERAAVARGVDEAMRENDEALDAVRAKMREAEACEDAAIQLALDLERKLGEAHDTFAACHRRAEDAERKLAALTKLARRAVARAEQDDPEVWPACDAMGAAIADAAHVAERHDREVRVKELRRMSYKARAEFLGIAEAGPTSVWAPCARWLRDEADRIERGEA